MYSEHHTDPGLSTEILGSRLEAHRRGGDGHQYSTGGKDTTQRPSKIFRHLSPHRTLCVCVHTHVLSHSVVSDSLQPHGL